MLLKTSVPHICMCHLQVFIETKKGNKASLDDLGQVEEHISRIKRHFSHVNNGLLIAFPKSGTSIAWCRSSYQKGSYMRDTYRLDRAQRSQDDDYITKLYHEVKTFRAT